MGIFRRTAVLVLALALLLPLPAAQAVGSRYSDVPPDNWAVDVIEKAADYGLMEGDNGTFGFGNFMLRAEFAAVLGRMLSWPQTAPETPSYTDCPPEKWYYSAVEAALENGAADPGPTFRPEEPITREEMAVMLVRALDYDQLAALERGADLPFPDVTSNRGYIALAWRFGIINGVEEGDKLLFYPRAYAPREQAAAMLVRAYERYCGGVDWLHGFYAFSSYSQIDLTVGMDAVSVGWARMNVDPETGPYLNQSSAGGNAWAVPAQASAATDYFQENGTPYNLCVFAGASPLTLPDGTVTNELYGLLETPERRAQTVEALTAAVGDYAGLTIDFEGLRAPLKEPFAQFMADLRAALPQDKTLYVCVQPPDWYDGFDYRALGEVCDKVILMAHDYQWPSVPASYVGGTNTDTPVTPINYVYSALKAVTDPVTGVQDKGKLALAISIAGAGLQVDEEGRLISDVIYTPAPSTVITRLRQADTQRGWSDVYRNPYILYTTEDGGRYRLWYEDERSVMEKVRLARMLGVEGVSLWRIGTIPNYSDQGLDYDVWTALTAGR